MPRKGSTNRRRLGFREKELIFGTWNVQTLYKSKLGSSQPIKPTVPCKPYSDLGRYGSEGCVTAARSERMEEKS
jgi:hypothetical protein